MTTPTKTATEISNTIISQIENELNQTIPLFPKAFNRVLAKTFGGVFVTLYKFAGFILLQMFVRTCSDKDMTVGGVTINPLREWGALVGLEKTLGDKAQYTIEVDVLDQTGDTVQAGTQLIKSDTQSIYFTDAAFDLDAATKSVNVTAAETGTVPNLSVGDTIAFTSTPVPIGKDATVTAGITTGSNDETTEDFRQRVIDRFAARPQGGAYADYRIWGTENANVQSIYPYSGGEISGSGTGEVDLFIEAKTTYNEPNPDGLADQPLIDDVIDNYIDIDQSGVATRRPVNVLVNGASITRTDFETVISGLSPDTSENRSTIDEAVQDWFLGREPFIDGLDVPPRLDTITVSSLSGTVGRVAEALGATINRVSIEELGTPLSAPRVLAAGEKSKCSTITYEA
jgi:uncharacterized phage protein gp47/JayE